MALQTGIHDIAALRSVRFQTVKEFGIDNVNEILQRDLAAHNAIMLDMISLLCEPTTDALRVYGNSANGEMVEADEYTRAPTQRVQTGQTVGFPLKGFQYAIGWTEKWMAMHAPAEMAELVIAAQNAHRRRVRSEIAKAIYLSSNYTFNDFLVDKVDIGVKRLLNADSTNIPDGPFGESFNGATHTHYNAVNGLDDSAMKANIDDVVEHGHSNDIKVAIHYENQDAVQALTGFIPYEDPRLMLGTNEDHVQQRLNIRVINNRAIGLYKQAEVWVKPWAVEDYIFAWDAGSPEKPLTMRQRKQPGLQGLRVAATNSAFPLTAEYMEAEFGFGVWNRTNGAVLYIGGSSYTDPTILAV